MTTVLVIVVTVDHDFQRCFPQSIVAIIVADVDPWDFFLVFAKMSSIVFCMRTLVVVQEPDEFRGPCGGHLWVFKPKVIACLKKG